MKKIDIKANEHHEYYQRYIDKLADDTELISGFESGGRKIVEFFLSIPEEKLTHRYEADKWSTKEVLQHLVDTERIFIYRCFRIARGDVTPLAGFNQDEYIPPSHADEKPIAGLIREYEAVRAASRALLGTLRDEDLKAIGNASSWNLSARAAAFIILGHEIWHEEIIRQRYL